MTEYRVLKNMPGFCIGQLVEKDQLNNCMPLISINMLILGGWIEKAKEQDSLLDWINKIPFQLIDLESTYIKGTKVYHVPKIICKSIDHQYRTHYAEKFDEVWEEIFGGYFITRSEKIGLRNKIFGGK